MDSFGTRTLFVCAIWFSTSAIALDVAKPLTLRDAVEATLAANPDLKVFGYSLRAQQARIGQAGVRPSPEFSTELENAFGSGAAKELDVAEWTFSLSQVVEIGGKRRARISAAEEGFRGLTVGQQAAQLDVLAEVTRRFIHVAADEELLKLTRQATEVARHNAEAVGRRVQAARSPEVELHRASVALRRAEIDLRHAEHELTASRRKLAAMWAASTDNFGDVQADMYGMPTTTSFEELVGRLAKNPDFTKFASDARLRDAELRVAQTRRVPDITVSAGVRRLHETDDHAAVLGMSLPLFSAAQAGPAIGEAKALREQTDAARDAAFIKARAQLFEIYQELLHSIAETQILKKDLVPQMEEALRETEYAYDRGRYSYLELVDGQRAYLEVQRALIQSATNVHNFQAEIERLTGEPLATPTTREQP